MADVFDLQTPGRLIIRRPNGQVYLDSADRTLVRLGTATFPNVAITYPAFASETFSSIRQGGGSLVQDWSVGRETTSTTKTLGAVGTAAPDWLLVNAYGRWNSGTGDNIAYATYQEPVFPLQTWFPLNGGSLFVAEGRTSDGSQLPFLSRILTVQQSGANWVAVLKQSSRTFSRPDIPASEAPGTKKTGLSLSFDFNLCWGVFDL